MTTAANTAPLTEGQLRAVVRQVREKHPGARVIGIRHGGNWTGPKTLTVEDATYAVVSCASPLAFREQLGLLEESRAILLTPCDSEDLGADVMARLPRPRLLDVRPFDVLRDLFRARTVDPRVASWLAHALVTHAPAEGYDVSPTGAVDLDRLYATLLRDVLGLPSGRPDLADLLTWAGTTKTGRFVQGTPELRAGVAARLHEAVGPAARVILGLLGAGRGGDALPLGLIGDVVYPADEDQGTLQKVEGKLEHLAGCEIPRAVGRTWADASIRALRSLEDRAGVMTATLQRAEALVAELGVGPDAERSDHLDSGLVKRLDRLASTIEGALGSGGASPMAVEDAAKAVLRHQRLDEDRRAVVTMAVRLVRFLEGKSDSATGFAELSARYAGDGAYVDRARHRVAAGDIHSGLARVYSRLGVAATKRREEENLAFAHALAKWSKIPSDAKSKVVPIEHVLTRVVTPLAEEAPVLLLVMDGMSLPVFLELAEGLAEEGWTEVLPTGFNAPVLAVATLPTVTNWSRSSLLCGELVAGNQGVEKKRFPEHHGIKALPGKSAALFHKGDFKDGETAGLSDAVRAAIDDRSRRVVGVVINSIDDWLAKDTGLRTEWTPSFLSALRDFLGLARSSGRTLVMTSDHGHVLDLAMAYRNADTETSRARRPGGDLDADHEVEVTGPRVFGEGGRIVLVASEGIRYSSGQRGYHGGATPQEVLVPVAVLRSEVADVESAVNRLEPSWWAGEARPNSDVALKPAPPGELFGDPVESTLLESWVQGVPKSPLYKARKRQYARRAPRSDAIVVAILATLSQHGNRMQRSVLGREVELSPVRLNGQLNAIRFLLNEDGQEVLTYDDDEVRLDSGKLERLFGD